MGRYAVVLNDEVINVVVWDGITPWAPEEGEAVLVPEGEVAGIGWSYVDGVFAPPPEPEKTPEEHLAEAEAERAALVSQANALISGKMWPSKLNLGRLTEEEKALFNAWLDYIEVLNTLDLSTAPDIVWPDAP